jgi:hypothetical protein
MRRRLAQLHRGFHRLADDWRKYQAPSAAAMSSHLDQSRQRTPRKQGTPAANTLARRRLQSRCRFYGPATSSGFDGENTALSQCMDSGYIHVEALRSLNAADITAAYEAMLDSSANG